MWFKSVIVLIAVVLAGCYEDPKVVLHEPHIYKGKPDFHEEHSDNRIDALRQRFNQVQLDR